MDIEVDLDDQPVDQWEVIYQLLECPLCNRPILLQQKLDNFNYSEPEVIFPVAEKVSSALPEPIGRALLDAMNCFRAQAYTPTVIMCRKALEGMCEAKGIRERNLKASIQEMRKQGHIEVQLEEWATMLREEGNDAAHDLKTTFDATDARDLLDFTVALGEYLFTFKKRFEDLRSRRASARTIPSAQPPTN